MTPCAPTEADIFVQGEPISLDSVPEYFMAKNMQAWGAAVALPTGETWGSLADELDMRWGQHIWHPGHWEEQASA